MTGMVNEKEMVLRELSWFYKGFIIYILLFIMFCYMSISEKKILLISSILNVSTTVCYQKEIH